MILVTFRTVAKVFRYNLRYFRHLMRSPGDGLILNLTKCKVICFTHKKSSIKFDFTRNGHIIKRVSEICFQAFFWTTNKISIFFLHISNTSPKKASTALQFVRRQETYFNYDTIKILYSSLVRSNLKFTSAI